MSATTVKISRETSRKLEVLQARARLRSGNHVTKQSLIEDLVERASEQDEPPILLKAPKLPLPDKVRKLILQAPFDWGVETREEDIDRILSGEAE